MIVIGSAVPAFLWGVAVANIVLGVSIDQDMEFTGSLLTHGRGRSRSSWPLTSTDPAYSLTIENASSTDYTLTIMSWARSHIERRPRRSPIER